MSTIKVKRSAVQGKIPLTSDLQLGELAINTYDGKLYLKKNVNGTESIVDVNQGGSATDLLNLIKTVDGANSGLDAELLAGSPATNFSRKVMETSGGGATDSNYWAKIATYNITGSYNDGTYLYYFTNEEASGPSTAIISVYVRTNNVAALGPNSGSVSILAMHGTFGLSDNSFKLIDNGPGTPIELWVKKITSYCRFSVFEQAKQFELIQVTYNDGATWQVDEPVGTGNNIFSAGLQYRDQKIWHASNDGSGSGLDADLLDGLNSTSFLRTDTSSATSGALTVNNLLTVNPVSGSVEGGEIRFGLGTGQSGVNSSITVDTLDTRFRIFETGSPNRGFYFDLASVSSGQAKVWHSSNDGSGSGLDADLLDGIDSSSFMRSDQPDTFTSSSITFTQSASTLVGARPSNFAANTGLSILSNFLIDPATESSSSEDVRIINDLAGAHRWANSITVTNAYSSDRVTPITTIGSGAFDGTSSTVNVYTDANNTPIVIELDITKNELMYTTFVGIVFGAVQFRAQDVTIETFRNGAWQTDRSVTGSTSHIVSCGVFNNDINGVKKIRYTLSNPVAANGVIRIHTLFAVNFRSGDNPYGGVHYIDKYKDVAHYNSIWPATGNTYSLGTTDLRYNNVYTKNLNAIAITAGVWNGSVIDGTYGGTGVNNGTRTITIGGNVSTANTFTTSGNFALTLTATAATNVTLPTSGTLISSADTGTVTSTMIADGTIVNGDINASAAIAVSKLAASTISGVTLGNNLNTLTLGSYLTGTSYNGSAAITAAVDATSAATASKVVARDTSGNFSANTITATLNGNATTAGIADSANSLTTSRTIWGQSFNGTTDVTGNLTGVGNITGSSGVVVATTANGNITLQPNGSGVVEIRNDIALGTALNDSVRIKRVRGLVATNNFYNDHYVLRDSTGGLTDWHTTRWHDSIGIDTSFLTPRTDTRVWYERDPDNRIHEWGNAAISAMILAVGATAGTSTVSIDGAVSAIDFNSTSDLTVKENIKPISDAISKVSQIKGVTFNFINDADKRRHAGVIAQDVEKVLPEAVKEMSDGVKHVAYGNLIGLLIEAIKEQQNQIDELKSRYQ